MKHSNHLLHVGHRTSPPRRVSAGCAASGLALQLRGHQGCRDAPGSGDADPGVQDRLPPEKGPDAPRSAHACRAGIGVDAVDPAERVRAQELVMVGEMPVERWGQLVLLLLYLCFTWIGGVD
jgi:hypothetical protein